MTPEVPEYVTKPLLTRVIESSLDSDYAVAAQRAEAPTTRHRGGLVALALFGILVGVAIVQTTREADINSASRAVLLEQISQRRDSLSGQQRDLEKLRQEVTQLGVQLNAMQSSSRDSQRRLDRLERSTGFAAVRGPGLKLTVTDGPGHDDATRVRAQDLAILVDALYNAGAEAVSINDQRLTALTSLHNSGTSIGIDAVSLRSPYVVRALGDPRTLRPRLQESTHGLRWANLVSQLSFGYDISEERRMTLPAAQLHPLRAAATIGRTEKGRVDE